MDDLLLLLAGVLVAAVLGWLTGRLARGTGLPGMPLGAESRDTFWRRTLPWPTGVQEDNEIAWHVPRDDPPVPTLGRAVVAAGSAGSANTTAAAHVSLVKKGWSGRRDLNPRPYRPERYALPSCATPRPRCPDCRARA